MNYMYDNSIIVFFDVLWSSKYNHEITALCYYDCNVRFLNEDAG